MNTKENSSSQSAKDRLIVHSAQDDNHYKVSFQEKHQNQEESTMQGQNWLSYEFNRRPYKLFQYWLVMTFITAAITEPFLIFYQLKDLDHLLRAGLVVSSISLMLVMFGCGQMWFAISERKAALAQKGMIKFEFSMLGSLIGSFLVIKKTGPDSPNYPLFELFAVFIFPISLVFGLIGGLAVLEAFKKNHPLFRLEEASQDVTGFLEQNEAIASELSKYDDQLNRWPFLVYKCLLKFVIVLEIFVISLISISGIQHMWRFPMIESLIEPIAMLIPCSFAAFCCYDMEVVFRTKQLIKSQKAIFRLKICILVSIISSGIIGIISGKINSPSQLATIFALFSLAPVTTLIGALFVNKIIEQRDCFAKVSSYSGENYI